MSHDTQDTRKQQSLSSAGRAMVILAIVVAIIAGFGIGGAYFDTDEPLLPQRGEGAMEDARPVGAGTRPDGVVDEASEGLQNGTTPEDFLPRGAADPNTLMDSETVDAPQVPSIEQLDPSPSVDLDPPASAEGSDVLGQVGAENDEQ